MQPNEPEWVWWRPKLAWPATCSSEMPLLIGQCHLVEHSQTRRQPRVSCNFLRWTCSLSMRDDCTALLCLAVGEMRHDVQILQPSMCKILGNS